MDKIELLTQYFRPGTTAIIASRYTMGKTSLALRLAYHYCIEKDAPVSMFSLQTVRPALDKHLQKIHIVDKDGKKSTAYDMLKDARFYIEDKLPITIDEIENCIKEHAGLYGTKIVLIDYLHLLLEHSWSEECKIETLTILNKLKELAKTENICIIIIDRLWRIKEGQERRPDFDAFYAPHSENHVDTVMFLHREGFYNFNDATPADAEDITEIMVTQGRKTIDLINLEFDRNIGWYK